MITIDEALDAVLAAVVPLDHETVPLLAALGRTAAREVRARESVPAFDNSAMDGFAVRGAELAAGRRRFRVVADVPAGRPAGRAVGEGEAARIMTGAPLPEGADTVVPVEDTEVRGDEVTVTREAAVGANVRRAGEDVAAGDVVVAAGTAIGPAELGLLAAVGVDQVAVARRPRVAIVATGSELVPLGQPLPPGCLRDSNSYTAYAQALEAGAEPVRLGIARDDPVETERLLKAALEHDVVVTSGGVSVGDYDFVKDVQERLGVERRFWRVATKPGKPLAFGVRGRTLVFGVPGNPVAAMLSFELYVRPALLAMQGRRDIYRPWVLAVAEEPVRRTKERTEVCRCRLRRHPDHWGFVTTGPQGSGILTSMAAADGLLLVPPRFPGGEPGTVLPVVLLAGTARTRPPFPR